MKEILREILQEVRGHNKKFDAIDQKFDAIDKRFDAVDIRFNAIDERFDAIDKRLDSHDHKFISIDQQFERIRADNIIINSKLDEHGQMLRALLDVNEVRKAQLDAHEMRLSKVEGTIKGQATLALDELAKA